MDDSPSFDPERLLRTFAEQRITFTSLVPTHYIMTLALPEATRRAYDVSHVTRLLISSAPARRETKLAIMEAFPSSRLFEMYGSTEAGWVTVLRPDEQFTKLGSVGREMTGTGPVRLLDPDGQEIPDGEVGELYSRTPFAFSGYWRDPDRTAEAFRGDWCSVGDLARRDEDGYYHLVDRKSNMIITGGENVYPSEVEGVLGAHPAVQDVAVIGVPHEKWGEAVHAVVVPRPGSSPTEAELIQWCRERMAGYKRPQSVAFVDDAAMPRTATGQDPAPPPAGSARRAILTWQTFPHRRRRNASHHRRCHHRDRLHGQHPRPGSHPGPPGLPRGGGPPGAAGRRRHQRAGRRAGRLQAQHPALDHRLA